MNSEEVNDGFAQQFITAEKLEVHPNEAIVLQFRIDRLSLDDVKRAFEYVESKFPASMVLALPDDFSLRSCSKEVLEDFIRIASEVISCL